MAAPTPTTFEVPTGGDPSGALLAAITRARITAGGVYRLSVEHDEGCPCLASSGSISACTCEIIRVSREQIR